MRDFLRDCFLRSGGAVCVCGAAVPWRAACLNISMQLCGYSVVVRLCLGALRVSV